MPDVGNVSFAVVCFFVRFYESVQPFLVINLTDSVPFQHYYAIVYFVYPYYFKKDCSSGPQQQTCHCDTLDVVFVTEFHQVRRYFTTRQHPAQNDYAEYGMQQRLTQRELSPPYRFAVLHIRKRAEGNPFVDELSENTLKRMIDKFNFHSCENFEHRIVTSNGTPCVR
ncbi:hypothetical protein ANN_13525 [Periplaneta americana]|uniref:Uncharacterized protein n=1 Tax=Periplaneta americana TaxID=6978 RepID=A0ABQ8TLE4_PERAM|nr:hypothetical protein ANN_13525 [Periplaneta americana]